MNIFVSFTRCYIHNEITLHYPQGDQRYALTSGLCRLFIRKQTLIEIALLNRDLDTIL